MFYRVCAALIVAGLPTLAPAQTSSKPARPPQFQNLIQCRALPDAGARLSCFDREAAALDAAEARSDIVVVDRQQLRTTRRSLFGLSLPKIPFLNDENEKSEAPDTLEAAIQSAQATRDGKWVLQLDSAVWRTTETSSYIDDPRAGDQIRIKRGPLGSFSATINGGRPVKVTRVR